MDELKIGICKNCRRDNVILNKDDICIFCSTNISEIGFVISEDKQLSRKNDKNRK